MTRHQEVYNEDCALNVLCSQVQLARVVVRVILVDVVNVMLVLIAHVDVVHAVDTVFVAIFCSWRCTLYKKRLPETVSWCGCLCCVCSLLVCCASVSSLVGCFFWPRRRVCGCVG